MKLKLTFWHIAGFVALIPYVTIWLHEIGHCIWTYLSFGAVTSFESGCTQGRVTGSGIDIFVCAGAYSFGPTIAIMLYRKYGFKALVPMLCFCWITCQGIVSYSISPFGLRWGDFRSGLIPTMFVAAIEVALVNLWAHFVWPRIRASVQKHLRQSGVRPQSMLASSRIKRPGDLSAIKRLDFQKPSSITKNIIK